MSVSLEQLRNEFDRWAREGRGEQMKDGHLAVTEQIIGMMRLRPDSRVLDLGCGSGWATRLLAAHVQDGVAVGLDVSEEMVRQARNHGAVPPNANFRVLTGPRFPFHDGVFTHCLSIESLYYHPDITASLREVHRVLARGGRAFLMMNFFQENPYVHHWAGLLSVPVHLWSALDYCDAAHEAGFAECRHLTIPDPTPVAPDYRGPHYGDAEKMRAARAIGALVVIAQK
ncbi:MAG TPA: methyltransferase domain-containing protein [Vicinamibacterales bacterium]|jgi:SAM-dependent methyltransferase